MPASNHTLAAALTAFTFLVSMQVAKADSAAETGSSSFFLIHPTSSFGCKTRGRVVIDDGLKSADVDKGLDHHFDRIEHMMFIRTQVVAPEGGCSEVDDGCCRNERGLHQRRPAAPGAAVIEWIECIAGSEGQQIIRRLARLQCRR